MTDTLERDLAERLRAVAATVPDELTPPADLKLQVARRRKRKSRVVRMSGLAVAASVVIAVGILAVVAREPESRRVDVTNPNGSAVDLLAGMTMLDARDKFVIALDADGHQRITLATVERGEVVDAQLTHDHRTLWYLSVEGVPGSDCGEVVRADIASGASEIVAHAVAFGISPDGTRLALSGEGGCAPGAGAWLIVRDLANGSDALLERTQLPTGISWSPDGTRFATTSCTLTSCGQIHIIEVPANLDAGLRVTPVDVSGSSAAFGYDGLYLASGGSVIRDDGTTKSGAEVVFERAGIDVVQVVPTTRGIYVVTRSHSSGPPDGLSRLESGALVPVRTFADGFGTLAPIWPPR